MTEDGAGTGPQTDKRPGLSSVGEFGLIGKIRQAARTGDPRVLKSIGDDAAVVSAGEKTLITADLLVEDVHFKRSLTTPKLLGRKSAAVNLSDIAAMAGRPLFAILGLAAPGEFPLEDAEEFVQGFVDRCSEEGASLIGGDLCRSDRLVAAVTLIGEADPPGPVYRTGARIGDLVMITGVVGDSALGLMRLLEMEGPIRTEDIDADPLAGPIRAHLDPPARVAAGMGLASIATAMIDLSDGLVSDLTHILEESGVPGATINAAAIPLSNDFRKHFKIESDIRGEALRAAANGGEDYELLFTVRPENEDRTKQAVSSAGIVAATVGEITENEGIRFLDGAGDELPFPAPLFEHFSKEDMG